MKVLSINSVNRGSTGNIMNGIAQKCRSLGYEAITCVPKTRSNKSRKINNQIFIGSVFSRKLHGILGYRTGKHGTFSKLATKGLIKKIKKLRPDIIHLHNLHGSYVNLPLLFDFIKKSKIKTVWTLHDCWSVTGHCPHFDMIGCNKWKTDCCSCSQYSQYPAAKKDVSKWMHQKKKEWFLGANNLTITTPSNWLKGIIKESFLKDYPVEVINNGIDLSVFKPTESDFREKYNLEGKFIVLGVADSWGERKGLDVFIELSKKLDDRFKIVLVGTNDSVDRLLPENILSIHRTENQTELAKIYTSADVFVNPTREEVFGLVNAEALACGTPVLTFRTGGSPEVIDDKCGVVTQKNDLDAMFLQITKLCIERPFSSKDCMARASSFSKEDKFGEYVRLYTELLKK